MNVIDTKKKFDPAKTLEVIRKKHIDAHLIESAQTRVWNHLSHTIQQDSTDAKTQNNNNDDKSVSKGFWARYHKSFLTIGVATLIIIATAGSITYWGYQKGLPQNGSTSNVANNHEPVNLKKLAASRFKELNGISYEELKSVIREENSSGGNVTPLSNLAPTPNIFPLIAELPQVDSLKVEDLTLKIDKSERKAYYSEQEITLIEGEKNSAVINSYFGAGEGKHPKIDYNKPLVLRTWYGASFHKITITQGKSLIYFMLTENGYSIKYFGGSYAIKDSVTTPVYLTAVVESNLNPEITFLRSILENREAKQIGTEKGDDKAYLVIEIPSSDSAKFTDSILTTSPSSITTRYYVDEMTFKLHKTELYVDDILVQSVKEKSNNTVQIDETYLKTAQSEIEGIEMRVVEQSSAVENPRLHRIADLAKYYSVYYDPNRSKYFESIYDASITHLRENNDAFRLLHTKEFNPLYEEISQGDNSSRIFSIASYSQSGLRFEIYDNEPNPISQANSKKNTTVTQSSMTIIINGVERNAQFYEQRANPPTVTPEPSNLNVAPAFSDLLSVNYLIFEGEDGKWHQISEFQNNSVGSSVLKPGFVLKKMTVEEAKTIDQEIEERNRSYPTMQTTSLNDISKSLRLLPGDLSQTYKLKPVSVIIPQKHDPESKCEKYFMDTLAVDCLITKYNGFKIHYTLSEDNAPSGSHEKLLIAPDKNNNDVIYIVLDAPQDATKIMVNTYIPEYLKLVNKSHYFITEVKGKSILIMSSFEKEFSELINVIDFDKDLDVIKRQLNDGATSSNSASKNSSDQGQNGSSGQITQPKQ